MSNEREKEIEKRELLRKLLLEELNSDILHTLSNYDTGQVTASLVVTDEECVYKVKFPHLKEKPFTL